MRNRLTAWRERLRHLWGRSVSRLCARRPVGRLGEGRARLQHVILWVRRGRLARVLMLGAVAAALWGALLLALSLAPTLPLLDGLSFSPVVLDRQGQLLRMGLTADDKYRARVHLAEIAPHAVQAVLLYEDRHFYRHPGVNPLALARAMLGMARGERRMGGSTLTMQVVRLRHGLNTTTVAGKLRQMWLALVLERQYSKRQILEAYFCLAPYGGNVEGIAAASRIYFGHAPAQLSLTESLALAPVPQNPVRRWPLPQATAKAEGGKTATTSDAAEGKTRTGADFAVARARMEQLWAAAYPQDAPRLSRSGTLTPLRILGPSALPFEAPHVSAALLTAQGAEPFFSTSGAVLHTTLSLPLQKMLEQRLAGFAARGRIYGLSNAAAMLLHWPSMEIRALAGSAKFGDARISGQVDGTLARRSPGSTLKPFIYALALDQGLIHPQTLLVDSPRSFGGYDPENFDRSFRGPLPAHEALRSSRNIPAIGLASRLSPDLYSFLQRAGVKLPFSVEHYGLSLVLGGAEVSMRELVQLYAMLPNKGVWRPARLLQDAEEHSQTARALLSPEAAVLTLHMLEEPGREVRASRGGQGKKPLPHRYKTGTSNRFRDAWTVGVVGPYMLAVWAGNFDNSPNPLLVGGDVAAPLFEDIAEALSLREVLADAVPAMLEELNVIRITVCADTGDLDTTLCAKTVPTWYIPGRSPTRSSHIYRTILVDSRTGLRACQPSEFAREEVREFWPSDLQALFARAGIAKPAPPPYGPECAGVEGDAGQGSGQDSGQRAGQGVQSQALERKRGAGQGEQNQTTADGTGAAPRILSPRDGVVYQRRVGDEHSGRNAIPLTAGVDADVDTVFWFVDDRFVGRRPVSGQEGSAKAGGEGARGTGDGSQEQGDTAGEPLLWQPQGGTHTVRVVDNLGRASTRRVRVETLP